MNLHDVVMKLNGPILGTGESNTDDQHLTNLNELTNLIDLLLGEVARVAYQSISKESSVNTIGIYAKDYLLDLRRG